MYKEYEIVKAYLLERRMEPQMSWTRKVTSYNEMKPIDIENLVN
jgi:hypothetical protein